MSTYLKSKLDYDDYADIPTDGKRYELFDGILYMTPAPSPYHQRASRELQQQLMDYFHVRNLGEVFNAPIDLILTHHDVFQPDLLVVADPAQISARGIEGVPLLVVEILSPSTRTRDRTVKAQRYAALGVPHYWIADPDDQLLQCFRLEAGRYASVVEVQGARVLSHPDFPGLSLTLAKLWGK